ncbi:probable serine/threonine-protein kinase PBL21 [Coffea eugenioides]|uniref:probable serine/threonine-protein kinase PBL21 n=1 Tax=Coffea eugenioides TaxID=49369 RepID=UPI000F6051F4|nr:probable serine/threonine-protein kinase PBL21 [Coffea eugenioides]XP_027165686.1 probable serine/threonine-protein kinase PBL21 [Coffea eugenioides]
MATSIAAIVGGVGGILAFLVVISLIFWFCISHCQKPSNKNSETGSSDPSAVVELKRGGASSSTSPPLAGPQEARQFRLEELEQATRNFDEGNLIGCGSLGLVYKGLLCDGTVVAVKRLTGAPRREFVEEVIGLSRIHHRNLVTLLGYFQDGSYQMLIFEYLPNGSICNHLYDTGKEGMPKLEFRQRLSIALGAAKGLCYLHGQIPPLVHGNFKTANVLVDENFTAKVADAGLSILLGKFEFAGPSSTSANAFRDPEMVKMGRFFETSDVYSFGVFLLELITGMDASHMGAFGSSESVVTWVERHLDSNNMVDHRLVGSFTEEGMRDLIRLMLRCMSFPGRLRPTMEMVAIELDQILEKEIMLTTVVGEGTIVTLGSQLFTN